MPPPENESPTFSTANPVSSPWPSVRHPTFNMEGAISADWLAGDALRSQFFNGLSMIFPSGERYLVDSLRRAANEIADPALRQQVRGFIGQETMHRGIHAEFNRGLECLGLRNRAEPFIEWLIRHSTWLGTLDRLAITAGVEHFTSLFAEAVLKENDWLEGGHPELQAFWIWHAAEEIEHGAIPLAVYNTLGGGYVRRVLWLFYVWIILSGVALVQTVSNLHRRGALYRIKTWIPGVAFLLGRGSPGRIALAGLARYVRPGYVPAFNHREAQAWLTRNAHRFRRSPVADP